MKKYLLMMFLLVSPLLVTAQTTDREKHREKIRALKTAHITQGMSLTPKEAEQFWPVYNEFEKERRRLYRQEHAEVESYKCLDEKAATQKLNEYVDLEKQDYLLKKKYYQDLKKIFSATRIMQLREVENEFNEKLMREYRARNKK